MASISELLLAQGQVAADRELRRGQNLAALLSGAGRGLAALPGQITEAKAQQKAQSEVDLAHKLAAQFRRPDGTTDYQQVVSGLRQAGANDMADGMEAKLSQQLVSDAQRETADLQRQNIRSEIDYRAGQVKRQETADQLAADEQAQAKSRLAAVQATLQKFADPSTGRITDWGSAIDAVRAGGDIEAADELLKQWKATQEAGASEADRERRNAAVSLSRYTTPEDYAQRLAAVPERVRGLFPQTAPKNRNTLLVVGLTPKEQYDAAVEAAKPTGGAPERPSVWLSKGDQMRFVTPSQAAAMSADGWRSGNTREQGRPVTSGDAGELASIGEAIALTDRVNFTPGQTGTMAWLTGKVPDAVTNATGIGAESKSRQGIINLVKQIIGKGLEGGVLRKEDEYKYEKIIPTLSDAPDVVTSKVEQLRNVLNQKRDMRLDALEDAGYDVTRFRARQGTPKAATLGDGSIDVKNDPLGIRPKGGG